MLSRWRSLMPAVPLWVALLALPGPARASDHAPSEPAHADPEAPAQPASPQAARPVPEPHLTFRLADGLTLSLPGALRTLAGTVDGMAVAPADPHLSRTTPRDDFGYLRLRLEPGLTYMTSGFFRVYRLAAEAEFHFFPTMEEAPHGLEYDPRWEFREELPNIELTEAYLLAAGRDLAIKVGLMRSDFGLGMVSRRAIDASPGSVRRSPFGYGRRGDRTLRLQLAVFPLDPVPAREGAPPTVAPLTLVAAGDLVMDDDSARWAHGDRAYQAILGVSGQAEGFVGTLAGLYRDQEHAHGGHTQVGMLLLSASYDYHSEDADFFAEAELAGIWGETDFSQNALRPGSFEILSGGGVLRVGVRASFFEGVVEGGVASGDDNPFDKKIHTFTFDREYRVGLLLFGEALRASTAVTAYNLADPDYRAEPARGFDRVATGGAVSGALYVNPRIALTPTEGLVFQAGYLYAASERAYTDQFQSGLQGGAAAGPRGALGEHALGHEVDLGVAYRHRFPGVALQTRAQFAWCRPGAVFDTAAGEAAPPMTGVWLEMEVAW